jgi:hypothetical protein
MMLCLDRCRKVSLGKIKYLNCGTCIVSSLLIELLHQGCSSVRALQPPAKGDIEFADSADYSFIIHLKGAFQYRNEIFISPLF